MIYTFIIHIYSLIIELIAPFHRKARMMRLGQWKTNSTLREKIDRNARYIWFHASSLGEFEQGRPLMEKIKQRHPEYKILLTFFSPSGYEVRKNYSGADVICYLPFDTPYRVKKFLNLSNPAIAIFIKYEFWGNYLKELKKRGIPVYVVSAIFRPEQLFFKWYGYSYRKLLHLFTQLFVQDKNSMELLSHFGIKNVTVTGDTRFDRVLDVFHLSHPIEIVENFLKENRKENDIVVVTGSSWPQDEEILLDYINTHPNIKLIIAPHEIHREHLMYIQSRLSRPAIRLSEIATNSISKKDCLIIDGFGLLSSIYRYADITYVGGGFGAGVHNTLEAAVYGLPVIFGPNYYKFKEIKELIAIGGGFPINNSTSFSETMDTLVNDKGKRLAAGEKAGIFVKNNAGATEKILDIIFRNCAGI